MKIINKDNPQIYAEHHISANYLEPMTNMLRVNDSFYVWFAHYKGCKQFLESYYTALAMRGIPSNCSATVLYSSVCETVYLQQFKPLTDVATKCSFCDLLTIEYHNPVLQAIITLATSD